MSTMTAGASPPVRNAMIIGGITAMNVPMLGMKLAANTRNAHRIGNGTPSTARSTNESTAANRPSTARTSR